MCNVLEVAKFITSYAYRVGKPISNLALQYHLYLLWLYCLKEHKVILFNDLFHCWSGGPLIQEVYSEYCFYGGLKIQKDYKDIKLTASAIKMITEYLEKYLEKSLPDLQSIVLNENGLWYAMYVKERKERYAIIPFNRLVEFCNREEV